MNDAIYNAFLNLCGELSPENLTCDGELSASQVRTRLAQIHKRWRALEAQIGRKVTEDEVWGIYLQKSKPITSLNAQEAEIMVEKMWKGK
jgi:hypothetical protein